MPECCGNCIFNEYEECVQTNEITRFDYRCDFYKPTNDYKEFNETIEKRNKKWK